MLQEVIDLQNKAVNELLSAITNKDTVIFKSPTGSGKTIMMANLMNRILEEDKTVTFIVSSLSKSELAKQNYDSFKERSLTENRSLNPYLINSNVGTQAGLYIPTHYNVYVLPRDLYKENSKLDRGALIAFLEDKIKTSKLYLIKDEGHIKTNNLDQLAAYFNKTIYVSATPKTKKVDVVIDEASAINCHLIKSVEYRDETEDLNDALNKFVEIKAQYLKELQINPCIIIQISNKEKADQEIENIKHILDTKFNELKWMLIVDKENKCETNDKMNKLKVSKWKDYAKKSNGTIDVIIFKMVITEGWNIPRACMLYQVRDSKSKQLDEQVIGRVRRNPCLLNFEKLNSAQQKLATKAFVWSINPREQTKAIEVRLDDKAKNEIKQEMQVKTTTLKLESTKEFLCLNDQIAHLQKSPVKKSIFELYKQYQKASNTLTDLIDEQMNSFNDWIKYSSHIDKLELELKNVSTNYAQNLSVATDDLSVPIISSIQDESSFVETSYSNQIDNWVWERLDQNNDFSFDSKSEQEWFKILNKLTTQTVNNHSLIKYIDVKDGIFDKKIFLLAKNYLNNSEIKFEYYNYGKRNSYPDFVLKDYKGHLHIFESKSLNESSSFSFDKNAYEEKINALKECYLATSKLLDYYFYIPTKNKNDWVIFLYYKGTEKELNRDEFFNFFANL